MNIKIEKCLVYNDERGDLIQFVTKQVLQAEGLPFGQVYLLTFDGKGIIRGNHYHNKSCEMFCLIAGAVKMVFEDVDTQKRIEKVVIVNSREFSRIYIGPKVAHAIKSLSDFTIMVSYSSIEYAVNDTDKIPYKLL